MEVSRKKLCLTTAAAVVCFAVTICVSLTLRKYRQYVRRGSKVIVIIENANQWNKISPRLFADLEKNQVLGFDCEWVSCRNRIGPVALLQLATANGLCLLIRLCKMQTWELPSEIRNILAYKMVLKVGVGCHQDAEKLLKDYGLIVNGYLDLGWLASNSVGNLPGYGLSKLAKHILGVEMDKSWHVSCSDWEAVVLNDRQVNYAADDALIAVQLFLKLISRRQSIIKRLIYRLTDDWIKTVPELSHWLNRPFKANAARSTASKSSRSRRSCNGVRCVRKRPLYYNCQLQAPDGQPLCTCDVKKVQWYLDKELAEKVSETPCVIRLKFEPSRRPLPDEAFYLQDKDNCCVVCGSTDSGYICKNVVPNEYRRHFPRIMKDHRSHDVVLLCVECHRLSNQSDVHLRRELAETFAAPLLSSQTKRQRDSGVQKVKSAAKILTNLIVGGIIRALVNDGDRIPFARRCELEAIIKDHFRNVPETVITEEMLAEALSLESTSASSADTSHGLIVVTAMSRSEGLIALERMWRQHFLKTMQPAFLPTLWSADHGHESLWKRTLGTEDHRRLFGITEST